MNRLNCWCGVGISLILGLCQGALGETPIALQDDARMKTFCESAFAMDVRIGDKDENSNAIAKKTAFLFNAKSPSSFSGSNPSFFFSSLNVNQCLKYIANVSDLDPTFSIRAKKTLTRWDLAGKHLSSLYFNQHPLESVDPRKVFYIIDLPGALSVALASDILNRYNSSERLGAKKYEALWKINPYKRNELKSTDPLGGFNTIRAVKEYASSLAKSKGAVSQSPLPLMILDSTRNDPYEDGKKSPEQLLNGSLFPSAAQLQNAGVNTVFWIIDDNSWGAWNKGVSLNSTPRKDHRWPNECFFMKPIYYPSDLPHPTDLMGAFKNYIGHFVFYNIKLNTADQDCQGFSGGP